MIIHYDTLAVVASLEKWVLVSTNQALLEVAAGEGVAVSHRVDRELGLSILLDEELDVHEHLSDKCRFVLVTKSAAKGSDQISRAEILQHGIKASIQDLEQRRVASRGDLQALMDTQKRLTCVVIDIDGLSRINKECGHAVGDIVISQTSFCLARESRGSDQLFHLGAGIFVVAIHKALKVGVQSLLARLSASLSKNRVRLGDRLVEVEYNFSVAEASGVKISELLKQAEQGALVARSDGESAKKALARLKVGEGIHVLAQPIVRLATAEVVAYELLTRYSDEPYQLPPQFFRLAEDNREDLAVDMACVKACLEKGRTMKHPVHINVKPKTMSYYGEDFVKQCGGNLSGITFEITESEIVGVTKGLVEAVAALRNVGAKLALDDVGFGMSHLEALVELAPEKIKLDRRLVLENKWDSVLKYQAIAKTLNVNIVLEGIELRSDLHNALKCGLHLGQGYLFSPPK